MGRLGISENQVFQTADHLAGNGTHPSVDTVRIALGNTGSRSTINKHLKAWRERRAHREAAGANLSDHLRQVINEQVELLLTAIEAESGTKLQSKSQELEAAQRNHDKQKQQLDLALAQCQAQLAALQEIHEQQKLRQLHQQSQLADLREQNQSYREALAKEVGRRETLEHVTADYDRQLTAAHKELKAAQSRHETVTESHAGKTAELQSLQQRERDQRALVKEPTGEIKQLNQQLNAIRTQHNKDIELLARSLTELTRSTPKHTATRKASTKPKN